MDNARQGAKVQTWLITSLLCRSVERTLVCCVCSVMLHLDSASHTSRLLCKPPASWVLQMAVPDGRQEGEKVGEGLMSCSECCPLHRQPWTAGAAVSRFLLLPHYQLCRPLGVPESADHPTSGGPRRSCVTHSPAVPSPWGSVSLFLTVTTASCNY